MENPYDKKITIKKGLLPNAWVKKEVKIEESVVFMGIDSG